MPHRLIPTRIIRLGIERPRRLVQHRRRRQLRRPGGGTLAAFVRLEEHIADVSERLILSAASPVLPVLEGHGFRVVAELVEAGLGRGEKARSGAVTVSVAATGQPTGLGEEDGRVEEDEGEEGEDGEAAVEEEEEGLVPG